MFYRNTNHTQISTRIVTLAAGLALGAVAIIGAGELLEDGNASTLPTSPRANAVLPLVVAPEPDFGSVAADYSAFRQPATAPRLIGVVMPEPDFGSVPADYAAFRQPEEGPSAKLIVDPHFGTGPESISAIEGAN